MTHTLLIQLFRFNHTSEESFIYVVVNKNYTLEQLYMKAQSCYLQASKNYAYESLGRPIPLSDQIYHLFVCDPENKDTKGIPYDNNTTLEQFIEKYPSYFKCCSKNPNIHTTYKMFSVDLESYQVIQNEYFYTKSYFVDTISIFAKRMKKRVQSLLNCYASQKN
jgi:hypothetical protein